MSHGLTTGFTIHRIPQGVEYLIIDEDELFEGSRLGDLLGTRVMVLSKGSLFVDWSDYMATLRKDSPAIESIEGIKKLNQEFNQYTKK